jgi:uroporphyrinogen decarboxylase
MNSVGNAIIGLDWRTPIRQARQRLGANTVVQGNLDPALVLAGTEIALDGARQVLADNAGHPGHIFNLGHGVQPDTNPDVLHAIVDFVHSGGHS